MSTVVTPSGYLLVETKDAKRLILEKTRVVSQINSLVFHFEAEPKAIVHPSSQLLLLLLPLWCIFFFFFSPALDHSLLGPRQRSENDCPLEIDSWRRRDGRARRRRLATEQSRRCATLQLSLSDEFKLYYPLRGPIKKARRADDLMTRHKCTFFHMFKSEGR